MHDGDPFRRPTEPGERGDASSGGKIAPVPGALDGVRVVDFGRYIAGPFCACLLGDLGADVIRVERVDGGEDRFLAPVGADGVGALFLQVNRNKRGLTLDPMAPDGREVLRRLVVTADVVVANMPAATRAAMGLDYEGLKTLRPDVVLTTVDAFGSGGPYSERVGFDGVAQVMSGAAFDAPAVAASIATLMPRLRSTPVSWSSTSGRFAASLLPTTATVLNAGGMAPIRP